MNIGSPLRHRRPTRAVAAAFTIGLLGLFYIVALVSGNGSLIGISNWLVPDGFAIHEVLTVMRNQGIAAALESVPQQFAGVPINPALFLYYYPFVMLAGTLGYFLGNCVCLVLTVRKYWAALFLLVPYFLISMSLPSKDILVLCVSIILMNALAKQKYMAGLLCVASIFLIRDGAGVVAAAAWCVSVAMLRWRVGPVKIVLATLGVAVLLNFALVEFFGELFIVSRNLAIAEDAGRGELASGSSTSYLIRLFSNTTNLAFRPTPLDIHGDVALLSVFYWVSGISSLVATYYAARHLLKGGAPSDTLLPAIFFVSLVLISLNPLVQPRYQLPFVVLMLSRVFSIHQFKHVLLTYLVTILLSLAAATAYVYSGIGLPDRYEIGQPFRP